MEEQAVAHVGTIHLTESRLCVGEAAPFVNQQGEGYEFDGDTAGDSLVLSPDGSMIIISLRGPHPISETHAAQGSCPGIGVVTLNADRTGGDVTHVFGTFPSDFSGTRNLSDRGNEQQPPSPTAAAPVADSTIGDSSYGSPSGAMEPQCSRLCNTINMTKWSSSCHHSVIFPAYIAFHLLIGTRHQTLSR
ncbi:MAG: hypothetical protein OXJ56_03235 [Rhodospirillaceae bacterium]|nr:hypothetical protein [Rhodospirillaceae bacterium]